MAGGADHAWLARPAKRGLARPRDRGGALVALVLGGWSVLAWRQVQVWKDGFTLWTHALEVFPDSPVAQNNLALVLAARGDAAGAEAHFRTVTATWPTSAGAFQNLGRALAAQGKLTESAEALRRAAELAPGSVAVRIDLGTVLFNLGRIDAAANELERAVELAPESARAHRYLAIALGRLGRADEAERHRRRAAELDAIEASPAGPPSCRPDSGPDLAGTLPAGPASRVTTLARNQSMPHASALTRRRASSTFVGRDDGCPSHGPRGALQPSPAGAPGGRRHRDGRRLRSGSGASCRHVHVAPGLGNALGMLYDAQKAGAPLLVTAGQHDQTFNVTEPILWADLPPIARPFVKWSAEVRRLEDLPRMVHRAAKTALAPPTGPVFLSLPADVLQAEGVIELGAPTRVAARIRGDRAAVEAAAEVLARAGRPLILAGDAVAYGDAHAELVAVAETLGARVYAEGVANTASFPTSHPLGRSPGGGSQVLSEDVLSVGGTSDPSRPG